MSADVSEYVAERRAILNQVRQILRETMKLQMELEAIDPDAPLFGTGLGMDSVDAVELIVQLDAVFGLTLSGSPYASSKMRSVNTIVDAIMELRDEHR
jgi:acyl carrier protein